MPPMTAPMRIITTSQWPPSISVSRQSRRANALLTMIVVPTKPNQQNSPEMIPFLSVTWPGPRWPIRPASTQAMKISATNT